LKIMPGLLRRLYEESEAESQLRQIETPMHSLEAQLEGLPAVHKLSSALRRDRLQVIAEMKRKTPSMGVLSAAYAPAELATTYQAAGAAAISVLCQGASFGGSPDHLVRARQAAPRLPIMRKDFISQEFQIVEARVLGADAVLLICAGLTAARLRQLWQLATDLGLEALVEVHEAGEVQVALECGARMIGVNHRDLDTFAIDTGLTERLRPLIPAEVILVAESAIHNQADALRMRASGADAVLVGEALMRAADAGRVVEELSV